MSTKNLTYIYGCLIVAIFALEGIAADIDSNEIDAPEYFLYGGIKVYQGDRQCVLVGGLCVHTDDCLVPTTNKGLCPSSAHRGVECCYELPVRPAPCEQHLGMCMDRCHPRLMRPATDCPDQVCCILV